MNDAVDYGLLSRKSLCSEKPKDPLDKPSGILLGVKLTYPSGREAEYTYDDRQLLKTIEWETTQIEDRSYNDAGLLTGLDRTYVDETRAYNAAGRVIWSA